MSTLRPECHDSTKPITVNGPAAYYALYATVKAQPGLIHGQLHDRHRRQHCALGAYWAAQPAAVLPTSLVEEIAAINDAVPGMTPKQRKAHVLAYLRAKLRQAGLLAAPRRRRR